MVKRLIERVRRFVDRLAATSHDVAAGSVNLARPCTCGNPRKHGPCPRHGVLS